MVRGYELEIKTSAGTDTVDLTEAVQDRLRLSGLRDGVVVVFVPGSTGAVTTIEYESGVLNDLARAVERLAPEGLEYEHDRRWGDGNGYAHVRAALLGPSLCVPVREGRLVLGTWQQIVLLDFDNRPRQRRVLVQVLGEGGGL
ncbi:MAG: secondary thiamine-phosphate synthase enzyme YjbQ [Thermodesulfobacteriota bacterium]